MECALDGQIDGQVWGLWIRRLDRDFGFEASAGAHDAMRVVRHRVREHADVLSGGDKILHDLDALFRAWDVLGRDTAATLFLLEHESLRDVTQVKELIEL